MKLPIHLSFFLMVAFANAQNAPVANFSCDTVGTNPCCIGFNDLSTNSPASWSWSSPGGTPSTSGLQNPVICYTSSGTYTVILTVTNSFGSSTSMGTITVSPSVCSCSSTVGINEPGKASANNIFLFPNPVSNELKIQNAELKIEKVEIYNALGQSVFSQQPTASSQQQIVVNVSAFPKGFYFVKIINESGKESAAKFVKM
jgi:PKD repeat protein